MEIRMEQAPCPAPTLASACMWMSGAQCVWGVGTVASESRVHLEQTRRGSQQADAGGAPLPTVKTMSAGQHAPLCSQPAHCCRLHAACSPSAKGGTAPSRNTRAQIHHAMKNHIRWKNVRVTHTTVGNFILSEELTSPLFILPYGEM